MFIFKSKLKKPYRRILVYLVLHGNPTRCGVWKVEELGSGDYKATVLDRETGSEESK